MSGPRAAPWPAPLAGGPLDATVTLPGSKSLTARYLVLAALAATPSRLRGALVSRDTRLMAAALGALGASVQWEDDAGTPVARVTPGQIVAGGRVDCGLAGTVMRFIPPIAALAPGPVALDGDPAARRRPMAPLIEALRSLGVAVDDAGRGALPFTVRGRGRVSGGPVALDASASSQFLSALLLAGPRYERGIEVTETSGAMPSAPHAAMTAAALAEFGAAVEAAPPRWRAAGPLRGRDLAVEPDLSNAGPFLAAALVTGGRVRAPGWPRATTQAGDLLRQHLRAFGAEVSWADGTLSVEAGDGIVGVDLDLTAAGELAPALAALAVLADGPSRLRGIAHLRGHETDRLAALAAEIGRLGGRARQLPDGLEIEPGRLAGAVVETYGDHRMAAFAAIVGLAVPGVMASDIAATAKTMPDFPERWARLAAGA